MEYDLGNELGAGSFATVYECVSKDSKETLAVKIFTRDGINSEEEEDIRCEAYILMELSHPNITKCYRFFEETDYFYMVSIKIWQYSNRVVTRVVNNIPTRLN
jgi:serine/threonine protein kinase